MKTTSVTLDPDPNVIAGSIYDLTKGLAKAGRLKTENIEALAELTTELANRMKEGEFSGEQEG